MKESKMNRQTGQVFWTTPGLSSYWWFRRKLGVIHAQKIQTTSALLAEMLHLRQLSSYSMYEWTERRNPNEVPIIESVYVLFRCFLSFALRDLSGHKTLTLYQCHVIIYRAFLCAVFSLSVNTYSEIVFLFVCLFYMYDCRYFEMNETLLVVT